MAKKLSKKKNHFFINKFLKKQLFFVCIFLGAFLVSLISFSFAGLIPTESIVITSENLSFTNNEAGSWKITESARWISEEKARVTLDVETVADAKKESADKDVLLVVGTSSSIDENKFLSIKEKLVGLTENLLKEGSNSSVALVSFNSSFTVVNDFTNDRSVLAQNISSLQMSEGCSYYEALKGIDAVLRGYEKKSDKELIILFLTTSPPNKDMPNELGQYSYLKDQYANLKINAIQYGLGSDVLGTLEDISDKQYTVDGNTLNGALFDIVDMRQTFDEFKIVNYIDSDYFKIENLDSVNKVYGDAILEFEGEIPKVTFDLSDFLSSGNNTTITFDVILNTEKVTSGIFATHKKTQVITSVNGVSENILTEETPVVANNYEVTYNANLPNGCEISDEIPANTHYSVFDTVKVPEKLSCEGYQFRGWEVVSSKAVMVNTKSFIMPEEDVSIVGTWSRLSISKSMEGTIFEPQTLNDLIKNQSVLDDKASEFVTAENGIDFSTVSSDTNGKGVYELSSTKDDEFPVYYYRGAVDNNNIKFGGYCWKIVRTTSTGGVKLIYNGLPATDGSCNNTEATYQIGTSAFNSSNKLTDVGYMKNVNSYTGSPKTMSGHTWGTINGLTRYDKTSKFTPWYRILGMSVYTKTGLPSSLFDTATHYFGTSVSVSSSGYYTLSGTVKKLKAPQTSLGTSLASKYTHWSSSASTSSSTVSYIISSPYADLGSKKGSASYVNMSGGNVYSDYINRANNVTYVYGNSVSYVDGVYTLLDTTTYYPYQNATPLKGKYTCLSSETTCSTVYYGDSETYYFYQFTDGNTYESYYQNSISDEYTYTYGNDVTYSDGVYTLNDTFTSHWIDWSKDRATIQDKYHYTCLNNTTSCDTVYYIYYSNSSTIYYIPLTAGVKIDDIYNTLKLNETNSTIKTSIDSWYSNISFYEKYLEDTEWCNDREVVEIGGFDKDNLNTKNIEFKNYSFSDNEINLSCNNAGDQFSKTTSVGNGLLSNSIGLLTMDEVIMAGMDSATENTTNYLYTGTAWWTMTPSYFTSTSYNKLVNSTGYLTDSSVSTSYGVRPSISLKNGLMVMAGDGTVANPYILANNKVPINIDNENIRVTPNAAEVGETVTLSGKNPSAIVRISSFNLNGEVIVGNSFVMPEGEVNITDVVYTEIVPEVLIVESEHNPYPNNLSSKVYGEHTFEGATSLTVELTYQTESTSYDWVYLYNSPTSSTPLGNTKYGGTTKTTKKITVNGNYIKIVFRTDSSVNSYYGFYAKITANYD